MSKIVVLGAGISGHTAASYLRKLLSKEHEVIVIAPNSKWNWIPSNIWVGIGAMEPEDVTFELERVYKKIGVIFKQAKAIAIYPEGTQTTSKPFVQIEYTGRDLSGKKENVEYDYLINATGPKLNFEATPGLGPDKNSLSVCSASHAKQAAQELKKTIENMKKGKNAVFLVGTGHGQATCQGAAFEYVFNLDFVLKKEKVKDKAKIVFITNEYELGDFGMAGAHIKKGGYITHTKTFTESLFAERNVSWIKRAHIYKVESNKAYYETLYGSIHEIEFDFAMLIPPFVGVGLKAYNKTGEDITENLFTSNGFMKVDADYTQKPYEEWKAADWPKTYQNPAYKNIFAAGIAFAPPHAISKPMYSPNKTPIFPAPPRTGMPSAIIGRNCALNIASMIKHGNQTPKHTASMAEIGAACVASTGASLFSGTAASITVYPIVPDFEKYPEYGRDLYYTFGEIGLAGHWIKLLLHYAFIYKAKLKPFWFVLPE
ncbi:FAD/NAD(P)-binding oxidoreductase [Desulfurella sp.]|uniref:NAD(P)/FAD-dependent oxidoreductase n=1 Tax=Desulfurella sp. TaxID=1962857 RepID=UPI0025BE4AF8|nr:FAD/NAD(P)-binding oxidoreductase [Desulfurella sp.]